MGNEAAVKCSRARASMSVGEAAAMEEGLASLQAILDLNAEVGGADDAQVDVSSPSLSNPTFT
jgi:hypothetical protein